MFNNVALQITKTAQVRRLLAAVALACAFGAVANAEGLTPPVTPALITPDAGNTAFTVGHARGTQGYVCLPTSAGSSTASWTVKPARPEATLFLDFVGQDQQIITHFLSPNEEPNHDATRPLPFGNATWQSSTDSSKVWAQVLNMNVVIAGTDASCPNAGSIPCLLLQTVGAEDGPTRGTILSKTTFVQRLNTYGGAAPAEGCTGTADVGNQALVPYTADYFFYRKSK